MNDAEYFEYHKFMYWKSLSDDSKKLEKQLLSSYNQIIDETIDDVKNQIKSEFTSVDDLQRFLSEKWINASEEVRIEFINKFIVFALKDVDAEIENLEFNETVRRANNEQRKSMTESFKYFSKEVIAFLGDYTSTDSFEDVIERLNLLESTSKGFAKTIARTVSTQVTNTSLKESFRTVNKSNEYELIWVSMRDKRVRKSHKEADGKVMNEDGKFQLEDVELEYPGQFVNEEKAGESLNCRCYLRLIKKKGEKMESKELQSNKDFRLKAKFTKEDIDEKGFIKILASTYTVVDSYGDRIQFGAFDKHASNKLPKIVRNHDVSKIAGHFTKAYSLQPGDKTLPSNAQAFGGWVLEGQLNLNTTDGRELYEQLKAGDVDEFSVGYWLHDGEILADNTFLHKECECFEVSAVLRGANPSTGLLEMKSYQKAGRVLSTQNYNLIKNSVDTIRTAITDVEDLLNKASSSDEKSTKHIKTSLNDKTFDSVEINNKKERLKKLRLQKLKVNHQLLFKGR